MKRIISFILLLSIITSIFASNISVASASGDTDAEVQTSTEAEDIGSETQASTKVLNCGDYAPIIDGVIEDAYYKSYSISHEWAAEKNTSNYWGSGIWAFESDGVTTAYDWDKQPEATSYFLWENVSDTNFLYVAIDVNDSTGVFELPEEVLEQSLNAESGDYGIWLLDSVCPYFGIELDTLYTCSTRVDAGGNFGCLDGIEGLIDWKMWRQGHEENYDYGLWEVSYKYSDTEVDEYGDPLKTGYVVEMLWPMLDTCGSIFTEGGEFYYGLRVVDTPVDPAYGDYNNPEDFMMFEDLDEYNDPNHILTITEEAVVFNEESTGGEETTSDETAENPVLPDETPDIGSISVGSATAQRGDTIVLDVVLENNPGVKSMILEPIYDTSVLQLVSIITLGESIWADCDTSNGYYLWWNEAGNVYEDGLVLTLEFTVLDGAAVGDTVVSLIYYGGNEEETFPEIEIADGTVTVEPKSSGSLIVEGGELYTGQTIEIPVTLENNPGITVMVIEPIYDPTVLQLNSITAGEGVWEFADISDCYWWESASGEVYDDGLVLNLEFTVLETASHGDTKVSLLFDGVNDIEATPEIVVVDGVYTVHDVSLTETVAPTCTTDGYDVYTCNTCGNVYYDNYVSGHNYVDGVCDVCFLPEGIEYEEIDVGSSFIITGYTGTATELVIPDTIEGESVIWIGTSAFEGCTNLESVVIPDSVTPIMKSAFQGCTSLKSITIPNSVTYIGESAFEDCTSLTDVYYSGSSSDWAEITIDPDGNTCLTDANIHYDGDLGGEETTPVNTGSISVGNAVAHCGGVVTLDVVLSNNPGMMAMSLKPVYDSSVLQLISITPGEDIWANGQADVLYVWSNMDGNVYDDGLVLTLDFIVLDGAAVGDTVVSLEYDGINEKEKLPKIQIVDGTVTVESEHNYVNGICQYCLLPEGIVYETNDDGMTVTITDYTGSATELTIPDTINGKTVTVIDNRAFSECESLTSVTLPDSVYEIYSSAFEECTNLTTVKLPAGITRLPGWLFENCTNLKNVEIPSNVAVIESCVFENCTSLTNITIPESVYYIYGNLFEGCTNLQEIIVDENNLYYCSVDGVLFTKDMTELLSCPGGKIGSYVIPETVTQIHRSAFYECANLTSVTIPEGVTRIEDEAFLGCTSLECVDIPNEVTYIGSDAFYNCTALNKITIPESVTEIGDRAFYNCESLTSIAIPEGVIAIENRTFYNCVNLVSVDIPSSVTSIGQYAFFKCGKLTRVEIPEGVTKIEGYTFYNCASLESITIPEGVTYIDWGAFYGCTNLADVELPESLTGFGESAFSNCSNITKIALSKNYRGMGRGAFAFCDKLESITVDEANENYSSVDGVLFSKDGTELVCYPVGKSGEYVIPDGVTTINLFAFWTANGITSITIPKSVTTIYFAAFSSCENITDVYYAGSASEWSKITVESDNDSLFNANIHYDYVPHEHAYVGTETTAPTCTEDGVMTNTCGVCGDAYAEAITKLGHDEITDAAIEATCGATGLTEGSHCSRCGEVLVAQTEIPASGEHAYVGTETTAPTCTKDGVMTNICGVCGDSYTEAIAKLGHDEVTDAAIAATCGASGLTEGSHCSRCGEVLAAQTEISATGEHAYVGTETTAPTCTADGVMTYTCSGCGDIYTEVLSAIKHIDEDTDNMCDACGEKIGSAGDVNGDNTLDVKDLTRLMKMIAGEEVYTINPDVNGDGKVDVKDLTRLMKAIAGEDVELK